MASYVALLRGINVGGHRKVPMANLREVACSIGLTDPRTYVASGNLLFRSEETAPALEARLENAIQKHFGFDVDVIVRSADQWAVYRSGNPFLQESEKQPNLVMMTLGKRPATEEDVEKLRQKAAATRGWSGWGMRSGSGSETEPADRKSAPAPRAGRCGPLGTGERSQRSPECLGRDPDRRSPGLAGGSPTGEAQAPPIPSITLPVPSQTGQGVPSCSPVPLQCRQRFSPVPGVPGAASSPGLVSWGPDISGATP
jgi:uncharacterized protein (DUF1697 family)